MLTFYIIKTLFFATMAFVIAVLLTPILTKFLYKYKLGKSIRNTGATPVFTQLHAHKAGTPTMGGILIWFTLLLLIVTYAYLPRLIDLPFLDRLNFLSRQETFLPLGMLILSAIVGLIDDVLDVRRNGKGGLTMSHRLLAYTAIAIIGALWFFIKLDWTVLHVPFFGNFEIGWWYIPFFIFVIVGTAFSVNAIDGLDGLSGGTLLLAYAAFAIISFALGRYDLAVFCSVIVGGILAFLWFNIPPARFYMGDTGAMSLGVTLGIIAMLTNYALLLPIIGFLFMIETLSVILQIASKKLRGKKIFLSAPIHHHFEAMGWSEAKIVMRFWVVGGVMASIGLMIFLLDRSLT